MTATPQLFHHQNTLKTTEKDTIDIAIFINFTCGWQSKKTWLDLTCKQEKMSVRFIPHQSFFDAVKSGHLKYVKDSLENDGSDSNYPSASTSSVMELRNDKGETCLYVAAESNQEEVFRYLLKYCDVDVVKIKSAKTGLDAFHVAAKNGHLGISPLLSMYIYCIFL